MKVIKPNHSVWERTAPLPNQLALLPGFAMRSFGCGTTPA